MFGLKQKRQQRAEDARVLNEGMAKWNSYMTDQRNNFKPARPNLGILPQPAMNNYTADQARKSVAAQQAAQPTPAPTPVAPVYKTRGEAYQAARKQFGGNGTFEWQGKRYTTESAEEAAARLASKQGKPASQPVTQPTVGASPTGATPQQTTMPITNYLEEYPAQTYTPTPVASKPTTSSGYTQAPTSVSATTARHGMNNTVGGNFGIGESIVSATQSIGNGFKNFMNWLDRSAANNANNRNRNVNVQGR